MFLVAHQLCMPFLFGKLCMVAQITAPAPDNLMLAAQPSLTDIGQLQCKQFSMNNLPFSPHFRKGPIWHTVEILIMHNLIMHILNNALTLASEL